MKQALMKIFSQILQKKNYYYKTLENRDYGSTSTTLRAQKFNLHLNFNYRLGTASMFTIAYIRHTEICGQKERDSSWLGHYR